MRAFALQNGGGGSGFIGYPLLPIPSTVPGFASTWPGVQQRTDTAIPRQNSLASRACFEQSGPHADRGGGAEQTGDTYCVIGGDGHAAFVHVPYSMWAFVADSLLEPFAPLVDGFRLPVPVCGGGAVSDDKILIRYTVYCMDQYLSVYLYCVFRRVILLCIC